jgi:hypothetical protein
VEEQRTAPSIVYENSTFDFLSFLIKQQNVIVQNSLLTLENISANNGIPE